MQKVNLHFHTGADNKHCLPYSTKEAIDKSVAFGYTAIAITCHDSFEWTQEDAEYADKKGITLISGIEASVKDETGRQCDVIILNCNKDAEKICDFDDLYNYKKLHPEIFILAPHPFMYGDFSLQDNLEKHISLFDAVEHSWFYTKVFNRNLQAIEVAKKHNLPLISTSDTHWLSALRSDYSLVEASDRSVEEIFAAVRLGKLSNVTKPSNFLDTFGKFGLFTLKDKFLNIINKYF